MLTVLMASLMLFNTNPLPELILPTNPAAVSEPIEEDLNDEDVELLSLLVLAEAEGECDLGKKLVADVVLNRVDSELFPNTISEVVYEKDPVQFSSMYNGRSKKVTVDDATRELVREEMRNRYCDKTLYFRTKRYHGSTTPLYHIGNHYFSGQKEEK